ncbi:hypothetical protein CTKZ_00670 [Cellulomonas algicola]|uniref:Uncharacterized protein n=1 Tax=Cellulomonas algicola TaxID=2071633 RepID=A0A401UUZ7_9CELL|nr:hypothetical protein CTKZ_00670 [Cellulomonas algicola]
MPRGGQLEARRGADGRGWGHRARSSIALPGADVTAARGVRDEIAGRHRRVGGMSWMGPRPACGSSGEVQDRTVRWVVAAAHQRHEWTLTGLSCKPIGARDEVLFHVKRGT